MPRQVPTTEESRKYYSLAKYPSQGVFRWVMTGLKALNFLGNRCWKSSGETLLMGLIISKTEAAETGPNNRYKTGDW